MRGLTRVSLAPLELALGAHGQKVLLINKRHHFFAQGLVNKLKFILGQPGHLSALDALDLVFAFQIAGVLDVHIGDTDLTKFMLAFQFDEGTLALVAL